MVHTSNPRTGKGKTGGFLWLGSQSHCLIGEARTSETLSKIRRMTPEECH